MVIKVSYLWRFRKFPEKTLDPRYLRILMFLRDYGPVSSRVVAENLGYGEGFTRRALQFLRKSGAVEVFKASGKGLEDFGED